MRQHDLTGENLFLIWGYPTAFFLLVEFAALMLWNEPWCLWFSAGIPLVGVPLMAYFIHKDYNRFHHQTHLGNIAMVMWIFIGAVIGIGGTAIGYAGLFELCFHAMLGLMIGMGCFMTGAILKYKPMMVCGIVAAFLSFLPLYLQGDFWMWQLPVTAVIAVIALIIPGHSFKKHVKHYESV